MFSVVMTSKNHDVHTLLSLSMLPDGNITHGVFSGILIVYFIPDYRESMTKNFATLFICNW